jgi:hypothetical protein
VYTFWITLYHRNFHCQVTLQSDTAFWRVAGRSIYKYLDFYTIFGKSVVIRSGRNGSSLFIVLPARFLRCCKLTRGRISLIFCSPCLRCLKQMPLRLWSRTLLFAYDLHCHWFTEQVAVVVTYETSSVDAPFKFRPWYPLSWPRMFAIFLSLSTRMPG